MIKEPMLAATIENLDEVPYPVFASLKLDGIRAVVQGGKLLSRKLKDIPNIQVQQKFAGLPEGIDGELIFGDPADKHCFENTTSCVMSRNKNADQVQFYVFDWVGPEPFSQRNRKLADFVFNDKLKHHLVYVSQTRIASKEQLAVYEEAALDLGLEGVIARSIEGPYKQGRSTMKQGYLMKLKRFTDAEAKIVGFEEEQANTNEAKKNAVGHTERSSAKAGLVGKGTLGKFEVVGINGRFNTVDFSVGSGLDGDQKIKFWKQRDKLLGKIIKYKYFDVGSKDKPRHPIFLGFRDKKDL